jgi:hypothetical protein
MASFVRWSARVATEGDSCDGDGLGNGDGFLLLILLSEEEGQMLRPTAAPPGAGSERETERRELWRKGESAAAGRIDRPADRSVPDEGEEDHRPDDDIARALPYGVCLLVPVRIEDSDYISEFVLQMADAYVGMHTNNIGVELPAGTKRSMKSERVREVNLPPCRTA